jgi:hypothetical protein
MSDPRHTDPRYTDPQRSGSNDPAAPQPPDLGSQSSASTMLGWAAAIFAVIVVLALVIG